MNALNNAKSWLSFLDDASLLLINYIFDTIFKICAQNSVNGFILWNYRLTNKGQWDPECPVTTAVLARQELCSWPCTESIPSAYQLPDGCFCFIVRTVRLKRWYEYQEEFVKSSETIRWNTPLGSMQYILLKNLYPQNWIVNNVNSVDYE